MIYTAKDAEITDDTDELECRLWEKIPFFKNQPLQARPYQSLEKKEKNIWWKKSIIGQQVKINNNNLTLA